MGEEGLDRLRVVECSPDTPAVGGPDDHRDAELPVGAVADSGRLPDELVPGLFNTVLVLSSLQVGSLILTESVLSFLGVGIPRPAPSWGSMVSEGRDYISTAWWITFFPGLAILLIVFSMNFLGDWLRDRLDPRLRQL